MVVEEVRIPTLKMGQREQSQLKVNMGRGYGIENILNYDEIDSNF